MFIKGFYSNCITSYRILYFRKKKRCSWHYFPNGLRNYCKFFL